MICSLLSAALLAPRTSPHARNLLSSEARQTSSLVLLVAILIRKFDFIIYYLNKICIDII